ncbi:hypothetical protein TGMAS_254530B, partial [Toxoplasma gondii MAS]
SRVSLCSSASSPCIFSSAVADAADPSFALASSPLGASTHSAEAPVETDQRRLCVEDASGDPAAHSRMSCGVSEGSATPPSVSLVSAEASASSPSVAGIDVSSLQFLNPPPVPSSVLRHAEAEQHLLALRDTLEATTEALTFPAAAPVFSRKGHDPREGRCPETLRQGDCTYLFKDLDACSVLAQAVLWTQVAAAACSAQASEKLVCGALGCVRNLLGAPESRGALAGSCRAAAAAVVGLQSPETQVAAGVRSRLLSLAALWHNVSALRCRDSGVIYPLVEAVDAVAEAAGATPQSPPSSEVSPFARDALATVSGGEHPLTTLFVDLLLSACELQVLDLLAASTKYLLLQRAVDSLPTLSSSSLLLLLQSALLLAAEAATEVPTSALPQRRPPRPASQQLDAFLEASTAAPRARLANAEVYGHLLPCVMCEAARRFRAGAYIPPARELPLWLLARRLLLGPPFPALFASGERTEEALRSVGSGSRRVQAVGPVQLAWNVHERQGVRAFLKHLEWREAAASVDACVQSNRLPALLPLLYSPSPVFSPALPRSRSRACQASAPADPSRAGRPDLQRQSLPEFHGHDVGDCCWVARPSWASRWVSAVANAFATACSRTRGLAGVETSFRGRSVRPLHAVDPQSEFEAEAATDTLHTSRGGSLMQARQGSGPGARVDEAEQQRQQAAGDTDEDAIAQAIAAEVDRRGRGDRGETGGEEGGRGSVAKGAGAATKANRFVVLLALEAARTATRPSSELRVTLGQCVVEGIQMDGIARWGDGRVWGVLLDREEFWYRSIQSSQPRGRDAKPSAVLQLYVHLVTRLGRCGVAIVRRQTPRDVADVLEVLQTSSAI